MKVSVRAISCLVLGALLSPVVSRAAESGTPAISQLEDAAGAKVNALEAASKTTDHRLTAGENMPYQDLNDYDTGLGCFNPYGQNRRDNRRPIVISDEASYKELLKDVKPSCADESPKLLPVDFSKNVILGIKTVVDHSDAGEAYIRTVRRDDQKKKIIYFVHVKPGAYCDMCMSIEMNWIMIPIPPVGYAFDIWADTPDIPNAL